MVLGAAFFFAGAGAGFLAAAAALGVGLAGFFVGFAGGAGANPRPRWPGGVARGGAGAFGGLGAAGG